ncbi:hypothetical protein [Halorubrum sp. Atlit-26R]|uniref:hypothetical protein n=1 Tax=Halorubrum sp. Atlit-26R TaxID=2282128 RepID=UPI000EF1BB64|nr:hypothetical protein [Halorubrum sp. Atlit-26R]RLM60164.1 hypothetical protein DVK07_19485 [Halorubrum sp. Atlit-26R]
MSEPADRLRDAADQVSDARGELPVDDLDVDAPDEAPTPEAIVEKIDGQLGELQVALQELAANVDVMEDIDDG